MLPVNITVLSGQSHFLKAFNQLHSWGEEGGRQSTDKNTPAFEYVYKFAKNRIFIYNKVYYVRFFCKLCKLFKFRC